MQLFGTDRVLLYDVDPWNRLGFGTPNFGDNVGTLSLPIANLADEMGRLQLFIMTHVDSMRSQPPGRNTVERICKMINRIKSVLEGRAISYNQPLTEGGHSSPAPKVWLIHPVPYFDSSIVKNHWLQEYNDLCMVALTNVYQHSDNNLPMTITEAFSREIFQYFAQMKLLVGRELLGIPRATLEAATFEFTAEHYAAYAPEAVTINTEAINDMGPIFSLPTEDDLKPLIVGIPATMILPNLKQYPIGPIPGLEGISGADLPAGEAALGTVGGAAGGGGATTTAGIGPPVV